MYTNSFYALYFTISLQSLILFLDDTSEGFPYPIIEDSDRRLCVQLGMLDEDELDSIGIPLPARAVFIIDPTKKYRLSILYPATTGRNFTQVFCCCRKQFTLYTSHIKLTIISCLTYSLWIARRPFCQSWMDRSFLLYSAIQMIHNPIC